MKVVVEKVSRKAVYLFEDSNDSVSLSDCLYSAAGIATDVNEATHELVSAPAPEEWVGGALAFDGVWSVVDTVLYDQHMQRKTAAQAETVRAERNARLAATDWQFRSDMNPSQALKDYCQALRDITKQPGFPWDFQWPTQPE